MVEMEKITDLAGNVARWESSLVQAITDYNKAMAAFREDHADVIESIQIMARALGDSKAELEEAIDSNRGLFVKPKSRSLNGIQFGLKKGKGVLSWSIKDSLLLKRIKRMFPKKSKQLIKVTETPVKNELAKLKADDLKKLGCTVTGTGDVVFVKVEQTDAEKAAAAILEAGEADTK